jgi:glycosyltransferase involved in cell wall biosynthesis
VNNLPLVSVIVNCFNSERFLKEAIESVYSQTYTNWEIIFWDNLSEDSSKDIALSFDSRIKYYRSEIHTSLGLARRMAMKKASGKYLSFLDCDDVYLPTKIEKQVSVLEHSGRAFSYSSFININEEGRQISTINVLNKSGYIFDALLKRYEISMVSAMILREFIISHKIEMDQTLKFSPDFNYFMRIASKTEVEVIPEILCKYRKVKGSLTKQSFSIMYKEDKYTLDMLASDSHLKSTHVESFDIAYKLLNHLKTVKYIDNGEYRLARKAFSELLSLKYKYFLIYPLLFSSAGRRLYMKLFFK